MSKIYFAAFLVLLVGCQSPVADQSKSSDLNSTFSDMLADYHNERMALYPLEATAAGESKYNDQLPNFLSPEYRTLKRTFYQSYLDKLKDVDHGKLSDKEKMSYDVLRWEAEINLANMEFPSYEKPIDQTWSMNLSFGQLASGAGSQPFETTTDYRNWLKRVDGYLEWAKTAKSNMRTGMKSGVVLPKSLVKKVIPQMESMAKGNVEDHLFYQPIKNLPTNFNESDKEKLTAEFQSMVAEKIIPAYKELADFFKNEYYAAARDSDGISEIPNGDKWYAHQIKKYTTTNMSADEIFNIGKSEVARLRSEMEKVKKQVGYEGDLTSFFDFVRNKRELMPFSTAEEVIANFNAIHEKMKPNLKKLFDLVPKTKFEVRRTEAFREASASGEYNPGSIDGTRPGIFYVPVPDASKYNIFADEDLFLHEAIPGHHYQVSLQQEDTELPEFRRTLWYSAYGEGWALYCESLGKELGLYTDPYQYFGMLSAEMHRAIRLVVDTGIHTKGWTREEAIKYSLENEAEPEASIISEIERYMANPGQALSYKIGQLKIMELRARAEKSMGDKFDIKTFHNKVLEVGCVPLQLLERRIDAWIGYN